MQKSQAEGWQIIGCPGSSSTTELAQKDWGIELMFNDMKNSSATLNIAAGVYPCE